MSLDCVENIGNTGDRGKFFTAAPKSTTTYRVAWCRSSGPDHAALFVNNWKQRIAENILVFVENI